MSSSPCASAAAALLWFVTASAFAQVTGTATYRERMSLPSSAVFEVTLEDVSRADAPSEVLGTARIEAPGNPPIAFAIPYDTLRIDTRRRYAIRAWITAGDTLLFTTDQSYPVLTAGHGSEVTLLMRRVAASAAAGTPPLENTYWKLTDLGDGPIEVSQPQVEPHLILHPSDMRLSGSGGCNRFTGGYELVGDRLTFKQMAGTMMACPSSMEIEGAFLKVLQRVERARVDQEQLELLDGFGSTLARFRAVYLR